MSEQGSSEDPADVIAQQDQAVAAARHVAECAVKFWRTLTEGGLPAELIDRLTANWLEWFVTDGDPDQDDD
ncbi:MAG: hypothetical protein ACOYXR_09350 [Nitrospirota bacterium]